MSPILQTDDGIKCTIPEERRKLLKKTYKKKYGKYKAWASATQNKCTVIDFKIMLGTAGEERNNSEMCLYKLDNACNAIGLDWRDVTDYYYQKIRAFEKQQTESNCKNIKNFDVYPISVEKLHIAVHCCYNGQPNHRVPLFEYLNEDQYEKQKCIALLGNAGSGKTKALKYLAIKCSKGEIFPDFIPIYIKLREGNLSNDNSLSQLLFERWKSLDIPEEKTEKIQDLIFKEGKLFLLLDGLDELTEDIRREAETQIYEFIKEYPSNRLIVTCRTASAKKDSQFSYIEIAGFTDDEIKAFIEQYFIVFLKNQNQTEYEQLFDELNKPENQQLKKLAEMPIFLSLICHVFNNDKQLPRKRYELYERSIAILLKQWNKHKHENLSVSEDCQKFMWYLAKETFENNKDFDDQLLQKKLDEYLQKNIHYDSNMFLEIIKSSGLLNEELLSQLSEYLKNIDNKTNQYTGILYGTRSRSGLLNKAADGRYSFTHLTFHEYLVAKYFVERIQPNQDDEAIKELVKHICDRQWREIFIFIVEMLKDPSNLLMKMKESIDEIVSEPELQNVLVWLEKKAKITTRYQPACIRANHMEEVINQGQLLFLSAKKLLDYNLDCPALHIDFYLQNCLSILLRTDVDKLSSRFSKVGWGIDRIIDPTFDEDYPLHENAKKCENRSQLFKTAPPWDDSKSGEFILKAVNKIIELSNDQDFKNALENLKKNYNNFETIDDNSRKGLREELKTIAQKYHDIPCKEELNEPQIEKLMKYYDANHLLVSCLNSDCELSDQKRNDIKAQLILPQKSQQNNIQVTSDCGHTITLDDEVINWFRKKANAQNGGNCQTLINDVLKAHIQQQNEFLETLRLLIREEIANIQK